MKRNLAFLYGVLTSSLLIAGSVYASTGAQNIRASFANISLWVNGKSVATSAEPFIYKDNVYVPISTVGHALNATVAWVNKPASVVVSNDVAIHPLRVYYNGNLMPSGITNNTSIYAIPWMSSAYQNATGVQAMVDSSGNVQASNSQSPGVPSGDTALVSLKPSTLLGDFTNTALYPQGRLSDYWIPSLLGQLYPGNYALQWAVMPGQDAKIPGVNYVLNAQYTTLTGLVGIDDASKNFSGAVQLSFLGDGKSLGQTGWIQSGAEPTPISINVSGVTSLQVEYQLKDAQGTVHDMGTAYQAPSQNLHGSVTDPIVAVDFVNAALTPIANRS